MSEPERPGGFGPWRWPVAFALVVALHLAAFLVLRRVSIPPVQPPETVVMIDLAPMAEAPAEPEPAPEPPIPEPEPTPAVQPEPPPPEPEPAPQPEPEPLPPEPPPPEPPPPEPPPPEPPPPEPPPPEPPPPVRAAPAPTPPKVAVPPRLVRPRPPAPAPVSTVPVAPTPPAPAPVARAAPSAQQVASWQSRLVAHLNRHKRYPAGAQSQRRQGVAMVRFRLMPDGSAHATVLHRSAGFDLLDMEAVELIARAQPLPVPDPHGSPLDLVIPIQFNLR